MQSMQILENGKGTGGLYLVRVFNGESDLFVSNMNGVEYEGFMSSITNRLLSPAR